jgi:hypothetical protein
MAWYKDSFTFFYRVNFTLPPLTLSGLRHGSISRMHDVELTNDELEGIQMETVVDYANYYADIFLEGT